LNNPLKYVDPDGRFVTIPWAIPAGVKLLAGATVLAGAALTSLGLENTGKGVMDAGNWVSDQANKMVNVITPEQTTNIPFPVTQGEGITQTTIAPSDATGTSNVMLATDSSKNEKHGDAGRAKIKAEKQIKQYEEQLKTATGSEKIKIKVKIRRVKEDADKKKKGNEDSRGVKR
jgi:hypothetical protein